VDIIYLDFQKADLKYDDRLKRLGLDRLENRRLRSDLIETYKILIGNYSINRELFFDIDDIGLRGHDSKLFKRRFRLDVRKFVFSNRVINSWNSLPTQCVNCNTVDTLKKVCFSCTGIGNRRE